MKLKSVFLLIFTLGLTACPNPDRVLFKINSFKSKIVVAENGELLKENDSIKWDDFAIRLNFDTEVLLASNFVHLGNVAFAKYQAWPQPYPRIINVMILNDKDDVKKNSVINFFEFYRENDIYIMVV